MECSKEEQRSTLNEERNDSDKECSDKARNVQEDNFSKELSARVPCDSAIGSDQESLKDHCKPQVEAVPEHSEDINKSKLDFDKRSTSSITDKVEHFELETLCIQDQLALSLFNASVNSAVEKIEQFLLDQRSIQMKRSLSPGIFQILSTVCSTYEGVKTQADKVGCAVSLMKTGNMLSLFYSFLGEVFRALTGGIDSALANSLLILLQLLAQLTNCSQELSQCIVSRGLMMEHVDELCMLRESSKNAEVIKIIVELNIIIIHNCAYATRISDYFVAAEFDCVPIFRPYAKSPHFEVRLHAKLILGYLSSLLSEEEIKESLQLMASDMDTFLEALKLSTTSNSHVVICQDCAFSTVEALTGLNNLVINAKNCEIIVHNNIIPSLAALFACGSISEQKAGCQLLWSILSSPGIGTKFKEQLQPSEIPFSDCLSLLSASKDESLSLLAQCVQFIVDANEEASNDVSRGLRFAKGCYLYGHFSECVSWCERIITYKDAEKQEDQNAAKCLLGKANFQIYRKSQFQLKKQNQLQLQFTPEYQAQHKRCYQITKSVISSLGAALNQSFLDPLSRENERKMLDIALLDYITQARTDPGCCLLCLRKRKLLKSHYFPKALFERFSRGLSTPSDLKVFRPSIEYRGPSKSAKEMVYSMFCANCERFISKHGETQFRPQFFSQIYDEVDPAQSTAEQEIKYGEWLYQFCLGIVFRGLAISYDEQFINCDKLYSLFRKCRELLCSIAPQDFPHLACTQSDPIQVAILINPSEARVAEDRQYPHMTKVLNSLLNYIYVQSPLESDVISRPHKVHCFMVHFGMINILVPIDSAECKAISSEYFIDPKGGVFTVPADEDRGKKLPKGIWNAFQCQAVMSEMEIIEWPEKVAKDIERKEFRQPSEALQKLFRFVESNRKANKALKEHVLPSPVPEIVKVVNFLPDQFLVRPSHDPSSVHLPPGHKILLHKNYELKQNVGETLFLVVGSQKPYSLEKPYIIYHRYEPGLQLHTGFFVSPLDVVAQEFLVDTWPKMLKERGEWEVIENILSVCHAVLPKLLDEKGIVNCTSLLKRVQHHMETSSEIPSYDLKCPAQQCCWYCKNLCEICMKPASFGYTVRTDKGTVLQFCSLSCQVFSGTSDSPASQIQVWEPPESPLFPQFHSYCIERNHQELLCMHIQGELSSGEYCMVNLALCIGDGKGHYPQNKVYVVYYLRTLKEQHVLEFFLGDDLQPEEALPYATSDIAEAAITRRRSTNELQKLVFMALMAKGYPNLQALLDKSS